MVAMLACLLAVLAPAHPLDDGAELSCELRVVSDTRLELWLEFQYRSVLASYAEFANGLDANLDGVVTEQELRLRFVRLADELAFDLGLSVNGMVIALEPDFARFRFRDLDNPEANTEHGLPTSTARIGYEFVFTAELAAPEAAREMEAELFFRGTQTVVHTPREQLTAVDLRSGAARDPKHVGWDLANAAFPRLKARWTANGAVMPREPALKAAAPTPEPAWVLPRRAGLGLGALLAVCGLWLLVRGRGRSRAVMLSGAMCLAAGLSVAAGAWLLAAGWSG
jgi:hypothetical protein